jgi:hypothetical protein
MESFLKDVLSYLIVKRKQAILLLEYLAECRGKRGKGVSVPIKLQVHRELIYEDLQILNKRGR